MARTRHGVERMARPPTREVSGHLVGPAAFKAVGTGDPRPAGSIPVHLRKSRVSCDSAGGATGEGTFGRQIGRAARSGQQVDGPWVGQRRRGQGAVAVDPGRLDRVGGGLHGRRPRRRGTRAATPRDGARRWPQGQHLRAGRRTIDVVAHGGAPSLDPSSRPRAGRAAGRRVRHRAAGLAPRPAGSAELQDPRGGAARRRVARRRPGAPPGLRRRRAAVPRRSAPRQRHPQP